MPLKTYQQNTLEQLDRYLDALKKACLNDEKAAKTIAEQKIDAPEELKKIPFAARKNLKKQGTLPGIKKIPIIRHAQVYGAEGTNGEDGILRGALWGCCRLGLFHYNELIC